MSAVKKNMYADSVAWAWQAFGMLAAGLALCVGGVVLCCRGGAEKKKEDEKEML
jgi:hypothetical protein